MCDGRFSCWNFHQTEQRADERSNGGINTGNTLAHLMDNFQSICFYCRTFWFHHILPAQILLPPMSDINLLDINRDPPAVCFLAVNELKKENGFTLILIFQGSHADTVLAVTWCCRRELYHTQCCTYMTRAGASTEDTVVMSFTFFLGIGGFSNLGGVYTLFTHGGYFTIPVFDYY